MQQEAIKQWCPRCQRATPTVIIEGKSCCSVCEPNGPHWWDDDEEIAEEDQ